VSEIPVRRPTRLSPLDILKVAEIPLASLLEVLFNQVLSTADPPSDWGTAGVAVLHKSGRTSDWANYRLISLLSVVGKLFESVLNIRLINLLNVNCLLNPAQIGCRGPGYRPQEHSTVLAEVIKSMARNRKRTFCAFLDVRKA
jgi:hypothetical protein